MTGVAWAQHNKRGGDTMRGVFELAQGRERQRQTEAWLTDAYVDFTEKRTDYVV